MSKKLFVILAVLFFVALSYSVSLAWHPRGHIMNAHPDQELLLRPGGGNDPKSQDHPWNGAIRPLPGLNEHPDQELLLRPGTELGHPWGEYGT